MSIYAILVGLGASLGIWRVAQSAPARLTERLVNGGLLVLLGGLVGARFGYCLFHIGYFFSRPAQIFQFWQGGLYWPGAALGGLIPLLFLLGVWRLPFSALIDGLAPLLPPLAVATWLGCWQSGVAYGMAAPQGAWWALISRDETGVFLPRFPLQIAASLLLLILLAWLDFLGKREKKAGWKGLLVILVLALTLLAMSFLRADPAPLWAGLRPDSWFAILLVLACLAGLRWVK